MLQAAFPACLGSKDAVTNLAMSPPREKTSPAPVHRRHCQDILTTKGPSTTLIPATYNPHQTRPALNSQTSLQARPKRGVLNVRNNSAKRQYPKPYLVYTPASHDNPWKPPFVSPAPI